MDRQIVGRKTAKDFPQELLDWFDLYVHGDIDRREFLGRAQKFATGAVTAVALWEMLKHNYAWAEQVSPTDARIKTERVTVASPNGNGEIKGLLVKPARVNGKLPVVLVVHENRGLNPYIEDVARRFGTLGFMALAPDGLTSVGGYPGTEEAGVAAFGKVDRNKMAADMVNAATWLKKHADANGKLGVVGFCFGGGVVNNLAVTMGADMQAGSAYYGAQPAAADVPKIKAALQLHYGSLDTRVNAGIPAYEEALKASKVNYEVFMYEAANHGFHNDTTPRYDEKAAKDSWDRTIAHFNKFLR
jgi:carboxymethylenebutenolidase